MMAVVLLAATELIAEFCERMQAKWPERTIRLAYAGGSTDARRPQALNLPMLATGVAASRVRARRARGLDVDERHAELNGSSLNERCAK